MSVAPAASAPSREAGAANTGQRHFYWLDWLRFLAAFFVLLDHACQANWAGIGTVVDPRLGPWERILLAPIHLGREAVVVFFVLSGALVGGLTLEKVRAGSFDARAYAADRIARVYVPLIPALLLSMGVAWAFNLHVVAWRYAGCLAGLQDVAMNGPKINSVLWTLAYEMWFYVLAGCAGTLFTAGPRRSRAVRVAAAAGGALALWALCGRLDWVYLACWLVGAFSFGLRARLGQAARRWFFVAGLAVLALGVFGWRAGLVPPLPIGSVRWRDAAAHLTLSVGTLLLVVGVCRAAPRTGIGRRIERAGTALAAFSYTLYLTHSPIVLSLLWNSGKEHDAVTPASVWRLAWWLVFCLSAAWVMYLLFERQTPLVRGWLRGWFAGSAAVRPSVAGRLAAAQ